MRPVDPPRPDLGAWPVVAATFVATGVWMSAAGLSFAWRSAVLPAGACAALQVLTIVYRTRRPEPGIAAALGGLAQIIGFCACASTLSYAVASTGGPLWDATFLAWDRALGLDGRAYLAFVDAHPWLGLALTLAYRSLMPQMALAITLLGFAGRLRALREFVLAFAVAGTATVLLSALLPAMDGFVHLRLSPADFPNLRPAAAYAHVAHLAGLRDGSLRVVSLDGIEGIITFPSFHTALGVLFAWTFWRVRAARVPALILNALLVASTPVDGGHYFVDVVAGAALAVAAIGVARRLSRTRDGAATGRTLGPSAGPRGA